VQGANVAETLFLVCRIRVEAFQIGRDGVELSRVESLGRTGRDPGPIRIEADRGAGALGQLARERVVEDADSDDAPAGAWLTSCSTGRTTTR